MIKKLLTILVIFCSFLSTATSQVAVDNTLAMASPSHALQQHQLKVFPNPAINFISLSKSEGVDQIRLYNVVGRLVVSFQVSPDEKYSISDIPSGMYLVQLLDEHKKVITTQRLHKR